MSGAGDAVRLVVRSADGAEVLTVPVQGGNAEIVALVAANIRASLRDGFYLDYPEGSGKQQPAAQGERP